MSNLVFHRDIFVEDEDFRLKRLPYYVTHEYFGGGKTSTSTQSVAIPPEVLARYNSVNATAEQTAQTPFQQYSSDPNAFVAPLNDTQQQGIANTNAGATTAQPYYGAATNMAVAGSGPTNVGQLNDGDIQQYMNPFVNSVVAPAAQLLNQQQQAQMSGQTGNAIKSGAFGGDRSGIAAANLAGQQSLSFANAINPLYSQAYTSGLGAAQQQQGFNLGQQQANLGRLSQGAQTIAGLGTGAQTAALQGAQSQLAAGQVGQQTEQAGKSALYNQFLQQQGYPFQTAQFLANIAEGTGALSGSTTTTTQPAPFFSDERLKDDVQPVGETYDGQKIIKFRYKGSPHTQIGLSAQNVEQHHPHAVGLAGGYKTVDYDAATKDAAERGHFYEGGLASQGGAVDLASTGEGFADGGAPGLAIFGMPGSQNTNSGLAAALAAGTPTHARQLMQPMTPPRANTPELTQIAQGVAGGNDIVKTLGTAGESLGKARDWWNGKTAARGGLVGYAQGGDVDDNPYDNPSIAPGSVPKALNIPNDQSHLSLHPASGAPGGGNQQSGLGQLAGGIKDIATIGAGVKGIGAGIKGAGNFLSGLGGAGAADAAAAAAAEAPLELSGATLGGLGAGAAASGMPAWLMALGLPFGVQRGGSVRQGLAGGGTPEDPSQEADLIAPGGQEVAYEKPRNPTFAEVAAIAADEAKKQGLDQRVVTDFVRGEYGNGSKYVGDDGSSGGPLQLHYGNTSSKYPHPGIGDDFTKQTGLDARDPSTYEASTRFGVQQMAKQGLTPWTTTMNKLGYAPDSAHTGQGGLGAISRASPDQVAQNDAATHPGLGAAPSYNQGPPQTGLAKMFEDNKGWLIPLMSGLSKMASSNSRYLGSAVLQGLGGAAEEYGKQQVQQAGIGNTEALTATERQRAAQLAIENAQKGFQITLQGDRIYWTKEYGRLTQQEYNALIAKGVKPTILNTEAATSLADVAKRGASGTALPPSIASPEAPKAPVIAPAGTEPEGSKPSTTQPAGGQSHPILESGPAFGAASKAAAAAENQGGPLHGSDLEASGNYQKNVLTASKTSIDTSKYTRELATALANINTGTGINVAGTKANARASIVNALNTMANGFGATTKDKDGNLIPLRFGDLAADKQLIDKVNILQGAMQAAGGDQRSFSALDALKSANPNAEMDPATSAKIVAQLMTDQVRAKDRETHMFQFKDASGNGGLLRAQNAFAADNKQENYDTLQAGLEQLISKSPKSYVELTTPRKYTYDQIRNKLKEGGYPPRIADIITGRI